MESPWSSALGRNDPGLLAKSDPLQAQKTAAMQGIDIRREGLAHGQMVAAMRIVMKMLILPGGKPSAWMKSIALPTMWTRGENAVLGMGHLTEHKWVTLGERRSRGRGK